LFHSSPEWSAGKLRSIAGKAFSFAGKFYGAVGDKVVLTGRWSDHPKFGRQLDVSSFCLDTDLDRDGLVKFLAASEAFKGLGPARARALVDAMGDDVEAALQRGAEDLAARARVPVEVVLATKAAWYARHEANRTMVELSRWGASPGQANKLYENFGAGVLKIITEDPYWLIGRLRGFGFKRVDELALAAGTPKEHPSRLEHALLFALEQQENEGHTWTEAATLLAEAETLLELDRVDSRLVIADAVERLIAEGRVYRRQVGGLTGLWSRRMWNAEMLVTRCLREHGQEPAFDRVLASHVLADLREDPQQRFADLNDAQLKAVWMSTQAKVSVITGGAGVGKTFTVAAIRDLWCSQNKTVLFCAPTGKAAQRMRDSLGKGTRATTIHVMLEPKSVESVSGEMHFTFGKGHLATDEDGTVLKPERIDYLDADLIVVDEVSMVDVTLFASLFAAVDWERTSVVLVGDHNQLPPVGAGAVLRDVYTYRPCPVTVLNVVMRQAGLLKQNVTQSLQGQVVASETNETGRTDLASWYVLDHWQELLGPTGLQEFVVALFEKRFSTYRYRVDNQGDAHPAGGEWKQVDPIWDVQLLTSQHKGPVGTMALNALMQRLHQRSLGVEVPPPKEGTHRIPFYRGDKVLQTKNDYDTGVMNGTLGRVLDNDLKAKRLTVQFEGLDAETVVEEEKRDHVQLAYAMTVHKSQGSEFPIVVFICHKSHSYMHHRGLFYTAVSRSRRCTMVLGDKWGIRNCAAVVKMDLRRSAIALCGGRLEDIDLLWREVEGGGKPPAAEEPAQDAPAARGERVEDFVDNDGAT